MKFFTWKTLFSQTGTEIYEISEKIGQYPDAIITNKSLDELESINPDLLKEAFNRFVFLPRKPSVEEYNTALGHATIVTLHGYLKILPPEVCERYNIYNGHPALINLYPALKGKDPQKRIWDAKGYLYHGHVIHEATKEVDAGKIVSVARFANPNIQEHFKTLEKYSNYLRIWAIQNWVNFLKDKVINNTYDY